MYVSELRQLLYNIQEDTDVKVILNDCEIKEIDYAYYSLEYDCFTIYVKP